MNPNNGIIPQDANGYPMYGDSPFTVQKDLTLSASNATATPPIFTVIGSVMITRIWGEVLTDLGANHTAAALRINDQTAQVYLTAVAGTTMSAIKAGSLMLKTGLVATALTKVDNAAGAIAEPATTQTHNFSPVIVTKKTNALTQIEYKYTTTDTPHSGKIRFNVAYIPLSSDGQVVPA